MADPAGLRQRSEQLHVMPGISPLHHRFTKTVNESLEISVTYEPVAGLPEKFDCFLEFANAHSESVEHGTDGSHPGSPGQREENDNNGKGVSGGWFSSLWGSEDTQLVAAGAPEVPLLLGYIQIMGYVRLNHQIGAETGGDSSQAVFWKNHEYASIYCSTDVDEKVHNILQTELFRKSKQEANKNAPGVPVKSNTVGGVPDLHAQTFDRTSHYLLHDLAHLFGTMDLPSPNTPPLTAHQQAELASSLSTYVLPIYVTAQHLIFASTTILAGQKCVYRFRIDVPPESLPPSYNNKLTGSLGDAGLASIAYLLIVGIQEQSDGEMQHRAVYFPMEFRPGHYGVGRRWFQHNYLQAPIFDQGWSPEKLYQGLAANDPYSETIFRIGADHSSKAKAGSTCTYSRGNADTTDKELPQDLLEKRERESNGREKRKEDALKKKQNAKKDRFLEELDSLIEGSLEAVAAKERRKSSVSSISPEDRGLILQMPEKPRVSYQIRVNNQSLCDLTTSSAIYHVGEDVHFFLKLHPEFRTSLRIVGLTAHIEAHEIFHVKDERKIVNIYKVTPTIKQNTYADALMFPFCDGREKAKAKSSGYVNIPRFLAQQFQASTFMDLRYFMVFRFVLNEFPEMESYRIDEDPKAFKEYVLAYKLETEANEFKFSIPLTVLP